VIDLTNEIDALLQKLFPIGRSITGDGNRETLMALQEHIPLRIIEYPSGMKVHDWVIPKEWRIRAGVIKDQNGKVLIDYRNSNLHVVSYSVPVHRQMTFDELRKKLFFLEEKPDSIPYRTTYYNLDWGFCLTFNDYKENFSGKETESFEVIIDSELFDGSLSVGELLIPGRSEKEILLSTYICHPSLANDNLSGVVLTCLLAKELLKRKPEYSFRILFLPETIGAISYCANNFSTMQKIAFGFVITTVGGPGKLGYKQSWNKEHFINSMVEYALKHTGEDFEVYPFSIHGSDERQYSSVGYRINTVTISKDKYYEYPQYHTSKDNLEFVNANNINKTLNIYFHLLEIINNNLTYTNTSPNCEVCLGRHELYPKVGGGILPGQTYSELDIILWLLFYCDGNSSLWEISQKTGIPFEEMVPVARKIETKGLLLKKNG